MYICVLDIGKKVTHSVAERVREREREGEKECKVLILVNSTTTNVANVSIYYLL